MNRRGKLPHTGEWVVEPVPIRYAIIGPTPRPFYLVTYLPGGAHPAHPVRTERAEAYLLCDALNELGWTERDYLAHGDDLERAIASDRFEAFRDAIRREARAAVRRSRWSRLGLLAPA